MMAYCPKCHEYLFSSGSHKCKPAWACQRLYDDNEQPAGDWKINDEAEYEKQTVYASDASTAAEKAISESDWWDGSIKHWRVIVISVNDVEERESADGMEVCECFPEGKYRVFDVRVEMEPSFYSSEVTA